MNLYLDIDGVLLTREGQAPEGLLAFLAYVTECYQCFWLTTHCAGSTDGPFLYLVGKWPSEAAPYIRLIRPTTFGALKTEGIDFSRPFLWLDDTLLESERLVLRLHGVEAAYRQVDVDADPLALRHELAMLKGVQ